MVEVALERSVVRDAVAGLETVATVKEADALDLLDSSARSAVLSSA